ncbi:hypothetical protein LTR56_018973 [Elasticomyces elasticus]|nr:hypothetical protein LTR56_018973 [Elasticomyces elasticus]KAK3635559.1 hypothetical protein LTR22_019127 [Elasticomyces elasticus]
MKRIQFAGTGFEPSLAKCLPAIFDVLLVSTWLFAKLRPWGPGTSDLYLGKALVTTPSPEVLHLKGLMERAMMRALREFNPRIDNGLIDALIMFKGVLYMLEGWEAITYHTRTVIRLEFEAILMCGGLREYPDPLVADIFTTVLSREVPSSEVSKCRNLMKTALQMVRDNAIIEIQKANSTGSKLSGSMRDEWETRNNACLLTCARLASSVSIGGTWRIENGAATGRSTAWCGDPRRERPTVARQHQDHVDARTILPTPLFATRLHLTLPFFSSTTVSLCKS